MQRNTKEPHKLDPRPGLDVAARGIRVTGKVLQGIRTLSLLKATGVVTVVVPAVVVVILGLWKAWELVARL